MREQVLRMAQTTLSLVSTSQHSSRWMGVEKRERKEPSPSWVGFDYWALCLNVISWQVICEACSGVIQAKRRTLKPNGISSALYLPICPTFSINFAVFLQKHRKKGLKLSGLYSRGSSSKTPAEEKQMFATHQDLFQHKKKR